MAAGRGASHTALTPTQVAESRAALGVDFGTYADATALEAAKPAASYRGAHAWIGGQRYASNGTAWVASPVSGDVAYTATIGGATTLPTVDAQGRRITVMKLTLSANTPTTMPPVDAIEPRSLTIKAYPASFAFSWVAGVAWRTSDGLAPAMTANKETILTFISHPGDTNWRGFLAGREA